MLPNALFALSFSSFNKSPTVSLNQLLKLFMPVQHVRMLIPILRTAFILLWVAAGAGVLLAQPKPVTGEQGSSAGSDESPFGKVEAGQAVDLKEILPIERQINPENYRLGPTDQLLLSIPGFEQANGGQFPLAVGMDNTVLLPRGLPLVDVRGMTLFAFRQTVDSLFRARGGKVYQSGVAVALVSPRAIYVRVSGDVPSPGPYVLSAADRASTAIAAANRLPKDLPDKQKGELERVEYQRNQSGIGTRDIGYTLSGSRTVRRLVIRHNDGTSDYADLVRYRAFGNDSDNPTLREGDEVVVEKISPFDPTIAIAGAVNATSEVPYRPGDNALMLLRLATGVREDADLDGAYIARYSSASAQRIPLNIRDTIALASQLLSPGDQFVVPRKAAVRTAARTGFVTVEGEVMNPSVYPVVNGQTKLSEVIAAAGGMTSNASLSGAHIIRGLDPNKYRTKPILSDPIAGMANSTLNLEDSTRFKFDNELQENRVSVDFVELFVKGNQEQDVTLLSGDEIIIPRDPGGVYVYGRVQRPGWVAIKQGVENEYYLKAAGGYTEAANAGRVIVEKYGTGVWEDICCTQITSGDRIYVPGDRDTPARTSLEVAGTIIGITSGILLIADTVIRLIEALTKKE